MTLRYKTLILVTTTTLLLIAVVLLLSNRIIKSSFANLEEQNLHQNARQTARLIDDEISKLESTLVDWARWDDSYQFVADGNRSYIENNLNPSSIVNLNLNFIVFTDIRGQMVYGKAVDLETESEVALPDALKSHILSNALLSGIADESVASGVILLPDFPVLIASAPVLNSLEKGPARGRLIIGRFINAAEMKAIAEKIQLSLTLHRFDAQYLSGKLARIVRKFAEGQQTVVNLPGNDRIEIYFVIKDIYGAPVLFMGIDNARAIYTQGERTLAYFTTFLFVIGGVFVVAAFGLIETVVLTRLRSVSRQVNAVETTGDFEGRVTLAGRDELSQLATDINKMLDSLQHSTERDRNILDNIVDGYCETDLEGRMLLTNRALCRMLAVSEAELHHMRIDEFIDPQDMSEIRQSLRACIAAKKPIRRISGRFRNKVGEIRYFDAAQNQITDSQGKPIGYRSIIRDMTELKQNEERLAYLAYHDALTGLYNRKAFMERLAEEIAYARRYHQERTLLFLDLDKFKAVNDSFGHDAGDLLLTMAARRIREELRETDVVARMGGDEFTILLTNPERVPTDLVVRRIAASLAKPFEINQHTIDFVSVSIGSKTFPRDAQAAEDLIKVADRDMYRIKSQRKHTRIGALIEQHQQAGKTGMESPAGPPEQTAMRKR